ncbi:sugar ABC transporter substrate-binding protein [Sphingomonas oleivorans]|uniref:Sugar ABC transporter substrate-binding protein n=1 Tax=Sphingomonas oleivorans TaxID=1735121 RepID=A0A2T5FYV7_9SPHN|nr:polysaccharide biosynthesis/export family protein [Sphingomonas oleivorans]PTQ11794.1 sugar ABC transporter substrate-binding protein [Sphingomonas oleivorans]
MKALMRLAAALAMPGLMVQSAMAATQAPASAGPVGYMLGINDEIQVSLFGRQPLDVKTRIKEDGTVILPYIGAIKAIDQTPSQLASAIGQKLEAGGYLVNPVVNVEVTSFISNAVTIFGNLQSPGVYPLDRPQNVAMMVARAGGVRADGADYVLLRRQGEAERTIPLADLSGDGGSGLALRPGDTLFVPPARQFFVYGQVKSPGNFAIRSKMTLRQALAQAGGPTLGGTEHKVTLYREGKKIKRVDLESEVQANDVLRVNEKLF